MKNQFFKFSGKCLFVGIFLTLMSFHQSFAQQTVTGTVYDGSNMPIPGANILIKGTTTGAVSDFDGNFSITASPTDVLVVSFLGYVTQNVTVGNQKNISVTLVEDASQLEEVVVIGYGTAKKKDLTGAVSSVSSKAFEAQPISRVEDALQGRASGVTVAKSSGAPGAGVKVRIRGVNSITGNNDPLVVIDGIIGGDLRSLNPNDIASMDILKDASATAIYGSRGANGVIMITTKQGAGKSTIDVDFFTTISTIQKYLPQLNAAEFATIENSRRIRIGANAIFTDADIAALELSGGTDYQREIFQTGIANTIQLSASGSEGKMKYFLSGNYTDQEGIILNTGYNKGSLRANVNADISDKLKIGLNIFGSKENTQNDLNSFNLFQGTLVYKALTWDPTTPVYNDLGEYNLRSIRSIGSLNDNPVRTLNESDFDDNRTRISGNFNLNYSFTNNFSYALIAGMTLTDFSSSKYNVETSSGLPSATYSSVASQSHQVSNILAWNKSFGNHNVKLTGVYEFSGSENRNNNYSAADMSLPLGFYLAPSVTSGASQTVSNNFNEGQIESYMFRGEYNLNQKLFLTATIRRDGSSVFQNNKWGNFPSVALAYSLDDLFQNSNILTSLKLRGGYGEVGNSGISPYSSFGLLGNNTYSFNGTSATPGNVLSSFSNPDLKWERTNQLNGGIDFGLFQNKLNISIDSYVKNTTDLLLNVPVSNTNGGNNGAISIQSNIGSVKNIGLDLSLSADILNNDNFTWNSNFNISFMQNEVTDLYDDLDFIDGNYLAPGGQGRAINIIEKGQPLGQFYGAVFEGTWKSTDVIPTKPGATEPIARPGDAKYKLDENFDPVFENIGNGIPTMLWGFNNTLTYKNWDLNVFFQGVHGFDVFNVMQAAIVGGAGDSRSFLDRDQLNQWTPTNETDIPAGTTFFNSSRYVEKGDFLRLSNLNIAYNFKNVKGFNSLKLYIGGQNLFMITSYSGYDPEHTSPTPNNVGNEDVRAGINIGAYPNPRVFNIGVKASL